MKIEAQQGFLQIPIALLLFALCLAGFGSLGLLHRWRQLSEIQLRLNACTRKAGLRLKSTIEGVQTENRRIEIARAAKAAALAAGLLAAVETAELTLRTIVLSQDARLLQWKLLQAAWLSRAFCKNAKDRPFPLPTLEWIRHPPDPLGPQPLVWAGPGTLPSEFRIEIGHSTRRSAAKVFHASPRESLLNEKSQWKAEFTAPRAWASID